MAEKGYYGLWFYLESEELDLEERTGLLSLHNTVGEAEAALDRQVQSAIEEWTAGAFAHDEENICVDELSFGSTGFGKKLYDCDYPEEFNAWFVEWVKAPEERSTTKSDQSSTQQHLTLAKEPEERSTTKSDQSSTRWHLTLAKEPEERSTIQSDYSRTQLFTRKFGYVGFCAAMKIGHRICGVRFLF